MNHTIVEHKTYGTREGVLDMLPCMKKPIVVHAKQINEPFRVKSLEGDYKQGKPGDYLMRGIDGELYICDRAIFERSYDFV
jgi:PGDYG protein